MDTLAALAHGFAVAATPYNLLWAAIGVTIGTAIGALPGLGPSTTVALLMPLTYNVHPTAAFIMFAGIYYGSQYGGSTASILLNTPGEPGSMMTAVDGNAMARRGRGAQALATAAIGSFVAGTLGTIALTFVAPLMVHARAEARSAGILRAHGAGARGGDRRHQRLGRQGARQPVDRAAARRSRPRSAVRTGALHLRHHRTARRHRRHDRRRRPVRGRRNAVRRVSKGSSLQDEILAVRGSLWMSREDWSRSWKAWLRGTAFGFPIGALPAGGAEVPTMLSYATEKRLSKNPEEFGHGAIEGVAGPEAANNASAAGALAPLLALGLPTSATAAVLLAAFQQYGLRPGPLLFNPTRNSSGD